MGLIESVLKTTAKIAIGVPLMIVGGMIDHVGNAANTQQNAKNLSDKDLADAFNNSTGSERDGYRAEIARRTGR